MLIFQQLKLYIYGAALMALLGLCSFAYWQYGKAQLYKAEVERTKAELEMVNKTLEAANKSVAALEAKMTEIRRKRNVERGRITKILENQNSADWSSSNLPATVVDFLRDNTKDNADKTP